MPVIIAGKRRGAKLIVPEGDGVRPTLVRVREALFSMLFSEFGSFEHLCVLDPFAGAGMLGLEAWSRGAKHVDFIELSKKHFAILNKNILTLKASSEVQTILGQSPRDFCKLSPRQYDLVLCDPPYHEGLMPATLDALIQNNLLRPGALVSIESDTASPIDIPEQWSIIKDRTYGKCRIQLITLQNKTQSAPETSA